MLKGVQKGYKVKDIKHFKTVQNSTEKDLKRYFRV